MEKRKAAGVLIVARTTGNCFLMKRADLGKYPMTWAMLSGEIDNGERPLDGLKREVGEEISIDPNIIEYHYAYTEKSNDLDFYYFIGFTDTEFEPTLNYENLAWGWFDKNDLPTPLYPRMGKKIFNLM
jgi:8-oxo-dGTP pyrophosphatase MutT (NUDIX family)